jgi:type I restriction enzyme S subunit
VKCRTLSSLLVEARSGYWGVDAGSSDANARVVRNGDIQEDGIRWHTLPTRGFSEDELNRAILREDDLLITTSGDCGYVAQIDHKPETPTVASNFVRLLRFDRDLVLPRFAYHVLRSDRFRAELAPFIRGTTLKNLAFATAAERVHVPVPDISIQASFAAILDKCDALRALRRKAISKLDQLHQSVFIDMFGDPRLNPRRFPLRRLSEFYGGPGEGTRCGPFGSTLKKSDVTESGVPLWNMDNISGAGQMQMPFRAWVSEQKAQDLAAYGVLDGDILISRAGTVGKMCVARSGEDKSLITTNLIRLRLGSQLVPEYFVALMTYCKGGVGRLKTGPDGAFTHMSTGILDTLSFPYPSIDLQRKWVDRSRAILKQKKELEGHLYLMGRQIESISSRLFSGARMS